MADRILTKRVDIKTLQKKSGVETGAESGAKNPDGKLRVTEWMRFPPADGVKLKIAATPAFPAKRSAAATSNVTDVTAPPITPEDTGG